MYLFTIVEYPATITVENGVRVLKDFQDSCTIIPEKWQIVEEKLPVKYGPMPPEMRCYFPDIDYSNNLDEIKRLVRNQADPEPSWYILKNHIIQLYGILIKYFNDYWCCYLLMDKAIIFIFLFSSLGTLEEAYSNLDKQKDLDFIYM